MFAKPSEEHHQDAPAKKDVREKPPCRQRLAKHQLIVIPKLRWHVKLHATYYIKNSPPRSVSEASD